MLLNQNQETLTQELFGEKYIYIYVSSRKEVLYVGQTRQSLIQRFKQHIRSNNAGARETDKIYFYKVPEEFSDYCEGYIGYFLQGKYQGCLPNYSKPKYQVPSKEIINDMDRIIRYFRENNTFQGHWLARVLLLQSLEYAELRREETIL